MRVSEYVLAAYYSWTTALALGLDLAPHIRTRTLIVNGSIAVAYAVLLRLRDRRWVDYVRDWTPQALMILAYKQMGWFAPAVHDYQLERQWIVWDRWLLRDLQFGAWVEVLGPVLPVAVEIAYSLVYALPPVTMGVLYWAGRREKADLLLTIYLLGLFLSYAQFPFWPSEPPRTVFAGEDLPRIHTPFRDFNLWLVGTQGIHTSVFPSAHVSGVWAAAFSVSIVLPEYRKLQAAYYIYATLVAVATVYGRYHFAVDALAGWVVAAVAAVFGHWLVRRRGRLY